jgi:hypothetical protein
MDEQAGHALLAAQRSERRHMVRANGACIALGLGQPGFPTEDHLPVDPTIAGLARVAD